MPQNVAIEEIGEVWSFPDEASPEQIKTAITGQLGRRSQKADLKSQQQAIAAQGETSTLRALDAEVAERIGQFKKGAVGVIPAALKTASTILSQPAYESEMMTEGAVTPRTSEPPEAKPLFQLGEMAQERMNKVWPEPENRDIFHDVARGGGQVSQMLAGGAVAKTLGATTKAATALAVATGGVQEFDDAFSRSRLRGDDPDTALAKSLGYSTVAAMIESRLGAGRLLRQLYPAAKEGVQKLTAMGVSKKLIGNFVSGGVEEGSQRVAQNWIVEGKPSMEGVLEEAIPGAIVQGIVGAPGAAVIPAQSPTAEFLRRAGAPATAAVAEEIGLPLLTAEEIGREVAPLTTAQAESGLTEALPVAPEAADIRILAQPSAQRISAAEAESGLREVLPDDPTTDIRRAPIPIGGQPLNPGGALKDLPPELQARSNSVKEQMRAEFEALKKKEAEKIVSVASKWKDTGKIYEGVVHSDAMEKAMESGDLPTTARSMEDLNGVPESEYAKIDGGFEHGFVTSTGRFVGRDEATKIAERSNQIIPREGGFDSGQLDATDLNLNPTPQPSSPTGARVKLPNSPQTYTTLERLAQTEVEKANGEQPMRIKNERTGKEEIVLESELTPVKDKVGGAKPKRTKADLNKALKEAGLDPSVFPDAKSKKSALERAIAKIEEAQKKLRGSRSTLSMGVPKAILDLILEAARLSLKAGNSLAKALEAAMAKARELLGDNFNEDELRESITTELTKSERKETQSTTFTGEYETSSRSRQIISAEQFAEGKTPKEVIDAIALFASGEIATGLSEENIPALLALTLRGLNNLISETKSPIEYAEAWSLIDRAANLFQQQSSKTGQRLEASKVAAEQLSHMAPVLAYRGLAKQSWAKALQLKPEVDPTQINPVTGSGTQAGQEVQKDIDSLNADAALMKAIKDSGINLSELFLDNDRATQAQRRKHLFEQIRQKFPNLTTEQKLKLEKALMDAWEKARLKVIRAQFKKFVGLPEVAAENIAKELQPELIRQANLGTLDDEAFRAALARKLRLPEINGETARELTRLSQDAQAAPEGVVRNKILQRMIDAIQKTNDAHPLDLIRDYWYNSALSGLRTFSAVLAGSWVHGAIMATQQAFDAAVVNQQPKIAARILQAYLLDTLEGVANGIDVIKTGDYTRRAEFADNINAVLGGKGRLDSIEGWKRHGDKWWKKMIGQMAYVRRIIVGLDYVGAIASRGSGIVYNAMLTGDAAQMEVAERRFNREQSKQAKAQAKAEMGKNAKWVDIKARQLEILEEGISFEVAQRAKVLGEIAALNAVPVGFGGMVYGMVEKLPKVIMSRAKGVSKPTADFAAFGVKAAIGLAFLRATINMAQNAANWMPIIGGVNWARAYAGKKLPPNHPFRVLSLLDENGQPLSDDRRRLIMAAQLSGIALGIIAYSLAGDDEDEFDVNGTWRGYTPQQKKLLLQAGQRPLSVRVGGKWIRFESLPIAGTLAVVGDMRDREKQSGKKMEFDLTAKTFASMLNSAASGPLYLKDLSTVSGMSQALGIAAVNTEDAGMNLNRIAAQVTRPIAGMIPFSSLVREADTWFDSQQYRPSAPLDYWIANLPIARRLVGEGPQYNMAGLPVESKLTPQSRFLVDKPQDPLVDALAELMSKGAFPHVPFDGGWIKDGEKFTGKQKPEQSYKYQVDTLKAWREIMLPDSAEIAKMTPKEYEAYYQKHLAPAAQVIHDDIQDELDPEVLSRKRSKTGNRSVDPRYEMKGEE